MYINHCHYTRRGAVARARIFRPSDAPRRLDRARHALRGQLNAIRTEAAPIEGLKQYGRFHQQRHPHAMGMPTNKAFLTDIAANQRVATPVQNQVLRALLLLAAEVLLPADGLKKLPAAL